MRKREIVNKIGTVLGAALLIGGCGAPKASESILKEDVHLVDVTDADALRIPIGRFAIRNVDTESFYIQEDDGKSTLLRCTHEFNYFTWRVGRGRDCSEFPIPDDIGNGTELAAGNMGKFQQTMMIYRDEENNYSACEYTRNIFGNIPTEANVCERIQWDEVEIIDAELVTMNSGNGFQAQTIWKNGNNELLICSHWKEGLLIKSIGEIDSCEPFAIPQTELLPSDLVTNTLDLRAVTADEMVRPKSFWKAQIPSEDGQSEATVVCYHYAPLTLWGSRNIGDVRYCEWYQAPEGLGMEGE